MKLEKHKASRGFSLLLSAVSVIALVQNVIIIFFGALIGKIKKRGVKFFKVFLSTAWNLGRSPYHFSSPFVDWFNRINHLGKVEGASAKVLSVFYNFDYKEGRILIGGRKRKSFWINHMNNSRGVANRKQLILDNLVEILRNYPKNEINFVSLASGSAEAVIEAIKLVPEKKIRALLVDANPWAIAEAKRRVGEAGLMENFSFEEKNILLAIRNIKGADIIEMAGFCDYLVDDNLAKYFQKIREALAPGGYFITCNIMPNKEKIFLDWVLLWPMYYRSSLRFEYILKEAGFAKPLMVIEPLEVHVIAICRK